METLKALSIILITLSANLTKLPSCNTAWALRQCDVKLLLFQEPYIPYTSLMDHYPSAERCIFMHPGMEWEDLKLGLSADAGSFLPPPQGPYRGLRKSCLYTHGNTNMVCISPIKNMLSAAKLLRNNTTQSISTSCHTIQKRHTGFYYTDKHPEIQLNLTSSENTQENRQLSV